MNPRELLSKLSEHSRNQFQEERRVLSFAEYLGLVAEAPERFTRDPARYLRDCFDYFGTEEIERPTGTAKRFTLFDLPFEEENSRAGYLVGQEKLQGQVYRALEGFEREGRINRLVLLHGPNGSAKSTFVSCLMRAMEAYSETEQGARYRFSWVFPRGIDGKSLGFSTESAPPPGDTYAHLPENRIDAKLTSELREDPLLLLPKEARREFIRSCKREGRVPESIWSGALSRKNQQIYEALRTAYRGDLSRVLAHVQVERYSISRRYRVGAVTIGPQMAVDARERQISQDRSLGALPASLSAVTLYETFGEIVDASGGILEFGDLLKRPLDTWKYLLSAIETGEVPLQLSNIPLQSVMMASSNALHLQAFMQHPEFASFQGRMALFPVGYLRDRHAEQQIYDSQIASQVQKHVAPHVTEMAALWAVLTRLRRAKADRYRDAELGRLATQLTPLEKALLYADREVPRRFEEEEQKRLREGIREIHEEPGGTLDYEGLIGASAREVRAILLDAASTEEDCLSPVALIERIEAFCERDDFAFLTLEPDHGYHDARAFTRIIRSRWLDAVDRELREASGLVERGQYLELFEKYVSHVSHAAKGEQLFNEVTQRYSDPDQPFMHSVEERLGVDKAEEFRGELLGRVAAWAIDNGAGPVDYEQVFPSWIQQLEAAYFEEHRKELREVADALLAELREGKALEEAGPTGVRFHGFGYEPSSLAIALGALMDERYRGE